MPAKLNSRWRSKDVPPRRYDPKRTVEHTRYVRQADGTRRRETDAPTEQKYCERMHTQPGWHRGAKVRKVIERKP
jgi:hypothetical protein